MFLWHHGAVCLIRRFPSVILSGDYWDLPYPPAVISRCERQGYCGYGIHCIVFAQYSQYFCRRSSQLHGGGSWVSVGTLRHSDPHDRPSYFCGKADVNFKRGQTVPLRVILPAPIRRI